MSYEQAFEMLPFEVRSKNTSEWQGEGYSNSSPNYTQCDFIDTRIDVYAQRALYQMLKGDPPSRKAAIAMFAAIKAGNLGGIYQEDQGVPALRAKALGRGWWQLIPQGQNSICVTKPASELPIIVFRKSIASDGLRVGQALRSAWSQCKLAEIPAPPPSGKPCPRRPQWYQVKSTSDKESERRGAQCIADAEKCLKQASYDMALSEVACSGNPVCMAAEGAKYLLALQRCRDALDACGDAAKRATNPQ